MYRRYPGTWLLLFGRKTKTPKTKTPKTKISKTKITINFPGAG